MRIFKMFLTSTRPRNGLLVDHTNNVGAAAVVEKLSQCLFHMLDILVVLEGIFDTGMRFAELVVVIEWMNSNSLF